ncbi:MAG: alpha-L-arabinofuranosidase C-terminal domain-containing protein [Tepidisphaeraceae bacterium]
MSVLFAAALSTAPAFGQPTESRGTLTVAVDKPGVAISPSLYGIFFEEINFAGDGGIYAEMLRNRSFEEPGDAPASWTLALGEGASGKLSVERKTGEGFNHARMIMTANAGSTGRVAAFNEGFWGVNVQKNGKYRFSIAATSSDVQALRVSLENRAGSVYTSQDIKLAPATGDELPLQSVELTSDSSDPNARLVISFTGAGSVSVDFASLFPLDTYAGRENGLRKDLVEKLKGLKPAFMRFPGGCWVEGETMATASRWKRTIGPVQSRWTQPNLWGYQSNNGLGYHEYLQMCEDLNTDALFVINCGMSHRETVPMDQMAEYVQDALDAIEYAIGPADSKWGSLRAKAGHPEPFKLRYIEVGNENGGPRYNERYALFYDAIKKAYPDIKIISCVWGGRANSRALEIVDEHYYDTPQFFFREFNHFDKYDRNGPKVYVGEYAVTRGSGAGNLIAAVGEAAFMIGMERNSDVVAMASYAPLFTHVNGKRWNPDLINFDNARSYGTPSYHVQTMFGHNRGDTVLPVELTPSAADANPAKLPQRGAAGLATWQTQAEFKDFKVTDLQGKTLYETTFENSEGWRGVGRVGQDGTPLPPTAIAQGQADGRGRRGGPWVVRDGMLVAQANNNATANVGDRAWTDYSVHVKARKTGGNEGFIVQSRVEDNDNYIWFNVGGWGNTHTGIERSRDGDRKQIGPGANFTVEPDRWYDLRLDVKGDKIEGYVDGKLVCSATDDSKPAPRLFAGASRDAASGDVIVKVVNGSNEPKPLTVKLNGATGVGSTATATVLTGQPDDENTLDTPTKVSPKTQTIEGLTANGFDHTFPACSVTVVRIPAAK